MNAIRIRCPWTIIKPINAVYVLLVMGTLLVGVGFITRDEISEICVALGGFVLIAALVACIILNFYKKCENDDEDYINHRIINLGPDLIKIPIQTDR